MNCKKSRAFTLAEVLITLVIIGVVASITIPTLIQTYKKKSWDTASQVFERKLEEATRSMNSAQVLAGYSSTAKFIDELNKYLKITKVCNSSDITNCFEDKVIWGTDNKEIDLTKIRQAKNFGQDNWDTELIGLQLANGTTGIIAYNPDCKQNPYSNQIKGTDCLAILYDTNGFKGPNTQEKDLRSINVIKLGQECALELDGACYGKAFYPNQLSIDECEKYAAKFGGDPSMCTHFFHGSSYRIWVDAAKTCGGSQYIAGTPGGLCTVGSGRMSAYQREMADKLGIIPQTEIHNGKTYDDVITLWKPNYRYGFCSHSGNYTGGGLGWYDGLVPAKTQAICKY